MIRILICGICGKMGYITAKEVDASPHFELLGGIDSKTPDGFEYAVWRSFENCPKADCIIDFSSTEAITNLTQYAVKSLTPLVLATTGYSDSNLELIKKSAETIPIFMSSNLSKGIKALKKASYEACNLLGSEYSISIYEKHHKYKKDSPSGTAIALKNELNSLCKTDISISSVRSGETVGEHTVLFISDNDVIEITHRALNRRIFALGALEAANYITQKKCGIYKEI